MYLQFPWKLHEMLRDAEKSPSILSVVSWLPHGKAFRVHKPEEFVLKVMPHYFRQTHYKSFQRQLNLWGFERISKGSDVGAYFSPYFIRGQPSLCGLMTRQKIKGVGGNNGALRSDTGTESPEGATATTDASDGRSGGTSRRSSFPSRLGTAAPTPQFSKGPRRSSYAADSAGRSFAFVKDTSQKTKDQCVENFASGTDEPSESGTFNPLNALADLALLAGKSPPGNAKESSGVASKEEATPESNTNTQGQIAPGITSCVEGPSSTKSNPMEPIVTKGATSKTRNDAGKNATGTREPQRPLSAYNIFFELQRRRILSGASLESEPTSDDFVQSIESILLTAKGQNKTKGKVSDPKTPEKLEEVPKDISHRIAEMWKTIDPVNRAILDCYASQEMRRYEAEVKLWREHKVASSLSLSSASYPPSKLPAPSRASSLDGDVIRALRGGQGDGSRRASLLDAIPVDRRLSTSTGGVASRLQSVFSSSTAMRTGAIAAANSTRRLPPQIPPIGIDGRTLPTHAVAGINGDSIIARAKQALVSMNAVTLNGSLNCSKPAESEPPKGVKGAEGATSCNPSTATKKLPFKKRHSIVLSETLGDSATNSSAPNPEGPGKHVRKKAKLSTPIESTFKAGMTAAERDADEEVGAADDYSKKEDGRGDVGDTKGETPTEPLPSQDVKDASSGKQGSRVPVGKPKERNRIVSGETWDLSAEELEHGIRYMLENPKAKRPHRQTTAGVGFQDLARQIAGKWKSIPSAHKAILESCAAHEMDRYKEAVEEWKAQVVASVESCHESGNVCESLEAEDKRAESDVVAIEGESNEPVEAAQDIKTAICRRSMSEGGAGARADASLTSSLLHGPERPIVDFLSGKRAQLLQRAKLTNPSLGGAETPILGFLRGGPSIADPTKGQDNMVALEQSRVALRTPFFKSPFSFPMSTANAAPSLAFGLLQRSLVPPPAASVSRLLGPSRVDLASGLLPLGQPWLKPTEKPRRPLSSYSLFRQIEQIRIAAGRTDNLNNEELAHCVENLLRIGAASGTIASPEQAPDFTNRWKDLCSQQKSILSAYAAKDLQRYRRELGIWTAAHGGSALEVAAAEASAVNDVQEPVDSVEVNDQPSVEATQRDKAHLNVPTQEPFPEAFSMKNEKQAMPFPFALHNMLYKAEKEGQSSVSWLAHGKAFRVNNKEVFVATMMSTYFKQTRFKSFQRQLNLWGFTRITDGADTGAYFHRYFVRGNPSLCKLMTRQKVKGTGTQAQSKSELPELATTGEETGSSVASQCCLSTLAACASDKVAMAPILRASPDLRLPNVSAITPECSSSSDESSDRTSQRSSQIREKALLVSKLALEVVGESSDS